ncbi:hypothetical protein [Oleiagrimonas sp.]|uniref:hypothetical protein n=1 Tax=Oleiagrimonas sp. TaxID=2010330 RepID=UPI002625115C|nr:hypothetical protein [Oleiagrimonas sp.]MDA3914088.1 hypothetical protein [Oleiagrimonas sp.]
MSRSIDCHHASRQAAMWRRLAEQCQQSGDHDLAKEAMKLCFHYRNRVNLVEARKARPEPCDS